MRFVLPVLAALVLTASAAAQPAAKPTLELTAVTPLTVKGEHFRPNERIVVVSSLLKTPKLVIRTNALGAFHATLRGILDHCRGLSIAAYGPNGERAGTGIGTIGCGVEKISRGPLT
jgi:hypothetical protein